MPARRRVQCRRPFCSLTCDCRYGNPFGKQPQHKALQVALHARSIEVDTEQYILTSAQVARQAADESLLLAPGKLFSSSDQPSPRLRFDVAHGDHAQVYRFI